jgi:DNA-binding PadR family transcriptional regulator
LARRVEDVARQAGCATPAEAALLPLLHQLEREGQVRARWRQGEKGLRRVYSLPGRGHGSRVLARVVGWLGHLSRSVGPATRRGALPAAKRGS